MQVLVGNWEGKVAMNRSKEHQENKTAWFAKDHKSHQDTAQNQNIQNKRFYQAHQVKKNL